MFDRFRLKNGKKDAEAQRAELEGDLARAVVLWTEAGRAEDAARVMVMRGDAEAIRARRRQHYDAGRGDGARESAAGADARRKKAALAIAAAKDGGTAWRRDRT